MEALDAVTTISDVTTFKAPSYSTGTGNLVPIEFVGLPFTPSRAFTIGEVPAGRERGLHAHRICHQLLIVVSGAVLVTVNDGELSREFLLNVPGEGLYIPPVIWSAQKYLERNSLLLVLASHPYSREEYIEDFKEYESEKLTRISESDSPQH